MLCCCFIYRATAQHWDSLSSGILSNVGSMYADSVNDYLYVGSNSMVSAGGHPAHGIAKWDGTTWSTFSIIPSSGDCRSIIRYNGSIYAAGNFYFGVPYLFVMKWNGTTWDSIGSAQYGGVTRLAICNNELFALGSYSNFAGITSANNILKWNGSNWSSVKDTIFNDYISSIVEYNGEMYIAGNFYNAVTGIWEICKWNGTSWVKLPNGGIYGGTDEVTDMIVYNNELYVAGLFTKADGNIGNYIQKWNGTNWSEVGGGVMGYMGGNGQINKMLIHHNKLYAFGDFSTAGGIHAQYIASWDGTNWCGFGSVFDNTLATGAIFKDSIYIGGFFHTIDGDSISHIAKWNGGNYLDTCGRMVAGINEIENNEEINIYPNPFTFQTIISFSSEQKNTTIYITDIVGKEIKTINFSGKELIIDKGEMSKGIYFVRITDSTKNVINRKIVVQ